MKRIIKAVCMALAVGAVAVPGGAVAQDEEKEAIGVDVTEEKACDEARYRAMLQAVGDLGSCDCNDDGGIWTCQ